MGIEAQGYSVRAAAREDFDAIVGLVRAADLVDWGSPDFTAEWLQHEWSFPQLDLASDTVLVERDGQVFAYACDTVPSLPQKARIPGRVASSRMRSLAITCFGVPAIIINSSSCFSSPGP